MDILIAALLLILYASLAGALVYIAVKKTWLFMLLLGVGAILAALPVGFLAEINISGCCGGSSNGKEGIGYVVAVLMGIVGVILIIISRKFKKRGTLQK